MQEGRGRAQTLSGGPEMTQHHVPTQPSLFRPHRTKLQEPALGKMRSCQDERLYKPPVNSGPQQALHIRQWLFNTAVSKDKILPVISHSTLTNGHPSHHGDKLNHITSLAKPSGMQLPENNNSKAQSPWAYSATTRMP